MNLTVQLPHAPEPAALQTHADRALRFALTRFATLLTEVRLRLVDDNGPRGGVDQRARVWLRLHQGEVLTVEAVDQDPRAAIARAADRASRALKRRLARARAPRGATRDVSQTWTMDRSDG